MTDTSLALFGGPPAVTRPLEPYRSVGTEEAEALRAVIDDNCLSGFYGSWGAEFLGGPRIRAFEERWAERFGGRFAISSNSATSSLFSAMAAIGISPGDEVIVPPTTMSASVMAPLLYGGIPVFADIEDETFCLDPEAVEAAITPRTKAIIVVNLFGHPAQLARLRDIADRHGLYLVEDNAQGPLAEEYGRPAGSVGHIGIFSLNYHKHIHTGEGGMCLTDDETLAGRLRMVRNHGENCIDDSGVNDITNLVGFNFRMTEMSAAIGLVQLDRIDAHVEKRIALAEALSGGLRNLEGITPPAVRPDCRHVYYTWTFKLDEAALGVDRETFLQALRAEGFPAYGGYVEPLYRLPLFQRRQAIGRDGFPFTLTDRSYEGELCPVAERLYRHEFALFETCAFDVDDELARQFVASVRKVHENRDALARAAAVRNRN